MNAGTHNKNAFSSISRQASGRPSVRAPKKASMQMAVKTKVNLLMSAKLNLAQQPKKQDVQTKEQPSKFNIFQNLKGKGIKSPMNKTSVTRNVKPNLTAEQTKQRHRNISLLQKVSQKATVNEKDTTRPASKATVKALSANSVG